MYVNIQIYGNMRDFVCLHYPCTAYSLNIHKYLAVPEFSYQFASKWFHYALTDSVVLKRQLGKLDEWRHQTKPSCPPELR